jgi:uncharacterized protein YbjT (DUF2867 family)
MKVAVAGATGLIGRQVVDVLRSRGHEVVPVSRSRGVDVVTGDGLAEALTGAECLVDVLNAGTTDQEAATQFFTAAARQIVVLSIIGADRFTAGYFAAKAAQEREVLAGPIPVRVLRAAQFHEFAGQMLEWGRRGDVVYVPWMRTQPVAVRVVAEALADLASGVPDAAERRAELTEIAGPQEEQLVDMVARLAAGRGDPVRVEGVADPNDPDRDLVKAGALLPGPAAILAGPTFQEWLDALGQS